MRRAREARDRALAAFDVETLEVRIRDHAYEVAAVAVSLDDVLAGSRFDELRRRLASWAGWSQEATAAREAELRTALERRSAGLAAKRAELRKRLVARDAAQAKYENRRRFVAQMTATIESLAGQANARFEQVRLHLRAAFFLARRPPEAERATRLAAAFQQMCRARRKRTRLLEALEPGASPLVMPFREGDLYQLPEGPRLEVRSFGLEAQGTVEAALSRDFERVAGEVEAASEALFRARVALAKARKELEMATLQAAAEDSAGSMVAPFERISRGPW